MKREQYPSFLDWWVVNQEEYEALTRAQDGDPSSLAQIIEAEGQLATREAREFVAARLKGEKLKSGSKRTVVQQAKELGILSLVREIQEELNCGEHTARDIFLERYEDICSNEDTLKTYVRRAKVTLEQMFGRKPPPVVQKGLNSEPE